MNLFDKTPFAWKKAVEWSGREEEFVKRAGFALMAVLAVHDKKAQDSDFAGLFPLIKKWSTDERNFVRKAVNWALRQVGKRNAFLNKKAIAAGREIAGIDSKAARWIAKDALKELQGSAVQRRLKNSAKTHKLTN
jgi:3-methyladenine DNA glycosylase AlkD